MKTFAWIGCTLLVASLGGLLAGCGASDEDQIMEIIRGSVEAYEKEDIEKFMGYMSEDVERSVNPTKENSIQFAGKEAVKAEFVQSFENWDDIKMVLSNTAVKVSGDIATVTTDAQSTFTNLEKDGIQEVVKGPFTTSLKKIDGVWKITKIENTVESWEAVE